MLLGDSIINRKITAGRIKIDFFPFLMLSPAAFFIIAICFYPIFAGIFMSFTNMSLMNPTFWKFIGLQNFREIAGDLEFRNALFFTIAYSLFGVFVSYLLGLTCALFMNRNFPFRGIIRAVLLIPWVMPAVVSTTSWLWLLNDQSGLINWLLKNLGIVKNPVLFLAQSNSARITVIFFDAWKNFPFMALILLSSMQSIPSDLYEAAYIDGANSFHSFIRITLPLIRRASLLVILLQSIWTFNSFDRIFLLTRGGPALATQIISIYAYNMAFYRNDLGYASGLSVSMMLFMILLTIIYFRITFRSEVD